MNCSHVRSTRRYYLLKSQAARALCETGLELVWLGKQEAEPGTALAADFPSAEALAAAHYTTVEDLTGASAKELVAEARLTTKQANDLLAALAAL